MRAVVAWAVMAVLVAMTMAVGVDAESSLTLTVRLYNTAGIPVRQLLAGRRTAESILRGAGLGVRFRQCGHLLSLEYLVDPCDEPLERSEVVVRIIDAPPFNATLHPDVYGMSYVVRETNHGWLATVFSDRIDGAATRAGVDPGTLLGRVTAHEVGHLLLGTGYHGQAGVMRAEWPDAQLNLERQDWHFSITEAAKMQRALAAITSDRFDPFSD
jgi:hypothetical protein